jgi:septal ring factor EnvC (AmiA/AmiB activator)
MNRYFLDFIALLDIGCWCVCFWWMHRISTRQDAMLDQLQRQAHRIEKVSKEEHEILTELHPKVQKIEKGIDEVSEKVTPTEQG